MIVRSWTVFCTQEECLECLTVVKRDQVVTRVEAHLEAIGRGWRYREGQGYRCPRHAGENPPPTTGYYTIYRGKRRYEVPAWVRLRSRGKSFQIVYSDGDRQMYRWLTTDAGRARFRANPPTQQEDHP